MAPSSIAARTRRRCELAEDDEVAPVGGHDLPVAAAQRALRPPAVLHEPGLAHRLDGAPADLLRPPALPARGPPTLRGVARRRGPRLRRGGVGARRSSPHGSHGASVCRRSGTRESGSTGTIRSAASGPATARVCRTASRRRAARIAAGSEISERWRPAGGPSPSTRRRSDVGRRGQLREPGGEREPHPPRVGMRLAERHAQPPRPALDERGREHDGAERPPAPLAPGDEAVDQQAERVLELRPGAGLGQLERLLQPLRRAPRDAAACRARGRGRAPAARRRRSDRPARPAAARRAPRASGSRTAPAARAAPPSRGASRAARSGAARGRRRGVPAGSAAARPSGLRPRPTAAERAASPPASPPPAAAGPWRRRRPRRSARGRRRAGPAHRGGRGG